MTWRLMNDSDDPSALLPTDVAATYSDLFTKHTQVIDLVEHLAGTKVIFGDRGEGDPLGIASWLDSERGALTIPELLINVRNMRERGVKYLTVYHSADNTQEIEERLAGVSYYQWVAWWGHLAQGRLHHVARQFLPAASLDIHVDLSVVHDDRWHPTLQGRALATLATDRLQRGRDLIAEAAAAIESIAP